MSPANPKVPRQVNIIHQQAPKIHTLNGLNELFGEIFAAFAHLLGNVVNVNRLPHPTSFPAGAACPTNRASSA